MLQKDDTRIAKQNGDKKCKKTYAVHFA